MDSGWVESVRRLVEYKQLWMAEQSLCKAEPLSHPGGIAPHNLVGRGNQVHGLKGLIDSPFRRVEDSAMYLEVFATCKMRIQRRRLHQRAYTSEQGRPV